MFGFFGIGQRRKARHIEQQCEIVQIALSSVLSRRGMSPQSITCELVHLARPGAASVVLVQLRIRAWNERLMREAGDFEAELLGLICLYSRSQRKTEYIMAWKFAVDIKNPNPKAAATASSRFAAAPAPGTVDTFELPKSAQDESESHYDYGFPATVIRHQ